MTKARNLSNFIGGNYDAPTGSLDNVTSVPSVITALDAKVVQTGNTGSAVVPSGNTAQRGAGVAGHFRFNTTDNQFEGYNGTTWGAVGGGASGSGGNPFVYENDQTVTVDYTLTSGKNGMTAGPITIADGVNVTIPDGSTWTIV